MENNFFCCFQLFHNLMPSNIYIFDYLIFMSQIVIYYLHSTSIFWFYTDVVLTLSTVRFSSIRSWQIWENFTYSPPGDKCHLVCCYSAMLTKYNFVKWTERKLIRSFSGPISCFTPIDEIESEQQYMLSCCHTTNTMPADALVTLGARASAGMILTSKSQNIRSQTEEELTPLPLTKWKQN